LGTRVKNFIDNIVFGIFIGIVIPLFFLYITYERNLKYIYLDFVSRKILIKEIFPAIFNWCILPNVLLFMISLSLNLNKTAKGLLLITVIETILIFIVKFIL